MFIFTFSKNQARSNSQHLQLSFSSQPVSQSKVGRRPWNPGLCNKNFQNAFWVSRSKRYKMPSRDYIQVTWPPAHDLASNNFGQSLDLDPTTFKLGDKLDIKLEIKIRFKTLEHLKGFFSPSTHSRISILFYTIIL